MEFYNGFTKKQIVNDFLKDCKQNRIKQIGNYKIQKFIASDTKEKIYTYKYRDCYSFVISKDNLKYEKIFYYNGIKIKSYKVNNVYCCFTGPAYLQVNTNGNFVCSYFINDEYYSRKKFNSFVKKTLGTTNFNRIRNIDKLKQMIPILEYHNRTEQLEALNKRLNCLKIIKELEK